MSAITHHYLFLTRWHWQFPVEIWSAWFAWFDFHPINAQMTASCACFSSSSARSSRSQKITEIQRPPRPHDQHMSTLTNNNTVPPTYQWGRRSPTTGWRRRNKKKWSCRRDNSHTQVCRHSSIAVHSARIGRDSKQTRVYCFSRTCFGTHTTAKGWSFFRRDSVMTCSIVV